MHRTPPPPALAPGEDCYIPSRAAGQGSLVTAVQSNAVSRTPGSWPAAGQLSVDKAVKKHRRSRVRIINPTRFGPPGPKARYDRTWLSQKVLPNAEQLAESALLRTQADIVHVGALGTRAGDVGWSRQLVAAPTARISALQCLSPPRSAQRRARN